MKNPGPESAGRASGKYHRPAMPRPADLLARLRIGIDRLGHLAVWMGLYSAAATIGFSRLSGLEISPTAVMAAFSTAMSVYLVDRVKLRDRWLDPADRAAHPDRYAFLTKRTGLVRALAAVMGLVGLGAAATLHPLAAATVAAAYGGVFVYAGRHATTGRRVKDILVVKNLAVAGSIAGLAGVMAVSGAASGAARRGEPFGAMVPSDLLLGAVFLAGQVLADAMLCDLDDAESDRRFGTATVASRYGRGAAWATALAIHAALAAMMAGWPAGAGTYGARWRWGMLTLGSTVALRLWNPRRVRDLVDLRLAAVAAAALAMG